MQEENKKLQEQLSSDIEMVKVQQENEQLRELSERLKADCDKARKVIVKLYSLNTKKKTIKKVQTIVDSCLFARFVSFVFHIRSY